MLLCEGPLALTVSELARDVKPKRNCDADVGTGEVLRVLCNQLSTLTDGVSSGIEIIFTFQILSHDEVTS